MPVLPGGRGEGEGRGVEGEWRGEEGERKGGNKSDVKNV